MKKLQKTIIKKKFFTESRIEKVIRFWFAGAVFFYVGWGTPLGKNSTIDFVFALALLSFLVEIIAVNPIVRLALNTDSTNEVRDKKLFKRVSSRIFHFLRVLSIVWLIYFSYSTINRLMIILFDLDSTAIVLPAEPIIFGLMYTTFHFLLKGLTNNIQNES